MSHNMVVEIARGAVPVHHPSTKGFSISRCMPSGLEPRLQAVFPFRLKPGLQLDANCTEKRKLAKIGANHEY